MSGSEGFLGRWSRRKQAAVRDAAPEVAVAPELPPIEGLGAGSDYSAFLQKGVAAVVQQAALRKAWTSDAGIADFRGMADYDWDFNAAGYGRLRVTDDVAALLKAVAGLVPEGEAPAVAAVETAPVRLSVAEVPLAVDAPGAVEVEPAAAADEAAASPRRHGSAMPC